MFRADGVSFVYLPVGESGIEISLKIMYTKSLTFRVINKSLSLVKKALFIISKYPTNKH